MSKYFKYIILISGFLVMSNVSKAEENLRVQNWTLENCLNYATENNISILRSGLKCDVSDIDLKEAKAQLFPSLTFNSNQNVSFESNGEENSIYTGSYKLNASMTLYNGNRRLNTIEQSKISRENSIWEFLTTSNNVRIQIIRQYYQLLYTHESVVTNSQIVETSLKELERSKELFKSGTISKIELAQVESQYKKDQYQLVVSQTAEAEALLSLKQILQLGKDDDFNVDFSIDLNSEIPLIPALNEVLDNALFVMPELKSAEGQIRISQIEKRIAQGEWIPTISLGASIGTGHTSLSDYNYAKQFGDGFNENIGLTISVPILNNRQTKSKVERAKISIIDAELNFQDAVLEVTNTIMTIHLDAISAFSQYESAISQLNAAEESYELIRQKFNLGMQNAVDLLVEKNYVLNAIQDKIQAKYSMLLDIKLLEFYNNLELYDAISN